MRWFREHKIFTTVVAIIIVLLLIIAKSYTNKGITSIIGGGVQKIVAVIEKPVAAITGGVGDTVSGVFGYKELQEENKKLKEEVEKLKQSNNNLKMQSDEYEELKDLSEIFDYEPFEGVDDAVAANIIAVDNSMIYKEFTIDVGKNKGVKAGDMVVNEDGLVGVVKEVTKNNAKISSVLENNNNISFILKKKGSVKGVVKGTGKTMLEGYLLDSDASVSEGDTLVTSGMGKFPKGISIGKVAQVEYDSDTQLKRITVKPNANFKTMGKVAVIG